MVKEKYRHTTTIANSDFIKELQSEYKESFIETMVSSVVSKMSTELSLEIPEYKLILTENPHDTFYKIKNKFKGIETYQFTGIDVFRGCGSDGYEINNASALVISNAGENHLIWLLNPKYVAEWCLKSTKTLRFNIALDACRLLYFYDYVRGYYNHCDALRCFGNYFGHYSTFDVDGLERCNTEFNCFKVALTFALKDTNEKDLYTGLDKLTTSAIKGYYDYAKNSSIYQLAGMYRALINKLNTNVSKEEYFKVYVETVIIPNIIIEYKDKCDRWENYKDTMIKAFNE